MVVYNATYSVYLSGPTVTHQTRSAFNTGNTATVYDVQNTSIFTISVGSSCSITCTDITHTMGGGNPYTISSNGINTQITLSISTSTSYDTLRTEYSGASDAAIGFDDIFGNQHNDTATAIGTSQVVVGFGIFICTDGFTFVNTSQYTDTPVKSGVSSYTDADGNQFTSSDESQATTFNSASVLLPNPSGNSGKMFFIKDKNWNAANSPITVVAPSGINIDGANTFTINSNGGCLTLVCDGTQYWIANYCNPGSEFLQNPSMGSNNKGTAIVNGVTRISTQGANGNLGLLQLPPANVGTICIIVCSGQLSWNGFIINSGFDNHTWSTPYVYDNNNLKYDNIGNGSRAKCAPSAIFISDGTTWYSVGTMQGQNLTWGGTTSSNSTSLTKFNTFATVSSHTNYTIQVLTTTSSTYIPGLSIYKNLSTITYVNGTNATLYGAESTPDFPRSSMSSLTVGGARSCIWFATFGGSLSTLYFPVITYVP